MEPTTDVPTTESDETIMKEIQRDDTLATRIFLEVYTALALLSVAANALIAFVIVKYRRLRQEKSNLILLHWTVFHSVFMLSSPMTFRLLVELDYFEVVTDSTFCFVSQMEYTLLLAVLLLTVLLTAYWYLRLYHPGAFAKFLRHLNYSIVSVYVFFVFCAGLHGESCYNHRIFKFSIVIWLLSFIAYIVFMFVINLVHLIKKRRLVDYNNSQNVPFLITNVFFLSYLPNMIGFFVGIFFTAETYGIIVNSVLLISVLNPVYFLIILYRCDKGYNSFLRHVISCRCKKYEEEFVEQPVVYNDENNIAENRC